MNLIQEYSEELILNQILRRSINDFAIEIPNQT